jgi:C4-dicarboxylate-specific signal transduction histidine kinase
MTMAPVFLLRDVLEPVRSILTNRGSIVDVELDCASDLAVLSDRLRLKQIVLNLVISAHKHVKRGFVRLRAETCEMGMCSIAVEDSGPGIPPEKRGRLFSKFQESLDLLDQGTGIGVCLSKHLAILIGGDV